jgi:hypothetical protein
MAFNVNPLQRKTFGWEIPGFLPVQPFEKKHLMAKPWGSPQTRSQKATTIYGTAA